MNTKNWPGSLNALVFLLFILSQQIFSAPHNGEKFELRQPDGSLVPVRVWGDEFYQDVECLEGFTLIRDPQTNWICYAELSQDGNEYVSTGVIYHGKSTTSRERPSRKNKRINKNAIRKKQQMVKDALGYDEVISEAPLRNVPPQFAPAPDDELDSEPMVVTGLTLLIDVSDQHATVSREEIDNYCNQAGYNSNRNNGSIYDYFYEVSNGLVRYNNIVTTYIRVTYPKSYYDQGPGYGPVSDLITDALTRLRDEGFDFSQLSTDRHNRVICLNVLYAGSATAGWANGLWPHMGTYMGRFSVDGVSFSRYQMTCIENELTLGTFVHENGHLLFGWPDLYSYDGHSNGVGSYCVMNTINSVTNPQMPNAWFRYIAGWITVTDITNSPLGTLYSHEANSHTAFAYYGETTGSSRELFMIEARRRTGRSSGLPGEGLLIWHIDQDGDNTKQGHVPMVALIQADGRRDLESMRNSGDRNDPFYAEHNDRFCDNSNPASVWNNGVSSGMDIGNISPIGNIMTFTIGPQQVIAYQLTVHNGTGSGMYGAGQEVSIDASQATQDGIFIKWISDDHTLENPYQRQNRIIMGDSDGSVTAIYAQPDTVPGRINAENFACEKGVLVTPGSAGISYVTWTNQGDFADYAVSSTSSGTALLSYRVTVPEGPAGFYLRDMTNDTMIDTINIVGTDVRNDWETITGRLVNLSLGTAVWRVENFSGSFGIEWFTVDRKIMLTVENGDGSGIYEPGETVTITAPRQNQGGSFVKWMSENLEIENPWSCSTSIITGSVNATVTAMFSPPVTLPGTVQAEDYIYQQHTTTETTTDENSTEHIRIRGDESTLEYLVRVRLKQTFQLFYRFSCRTDPATLILRDVTNNNVLDTFTATETGWRVWETSLSGKISPDTGTALWRIESTGGNIDLNWFKVQQMYGLIVHNGSGSGTYQVGSTVEIVADQPPQEGMFFTGWAGDSLALASLDNPSSATAIATIPDSIIELTATFDYPVTEGIVMPSGAGNQILVRDTMFFDDGGKYRNYSSNFSGELVLIPVKEQHRIVLTVESQEISENETNGVRDSLLIYSGSGEEKTLIAIVNGTEIPDSVASQSLDGTITVRFVSNGAETAMGWSIHITVEPDPAHSIAAHLRIPLNYDLSIYGSRIAFQLPCAQHVTITAFDIQGRVVSSLINGMRTPGYYSIASLLRNGKKIKSGYYILQMRAGEFNKRMRYLVVR